MKLQKGDKVLIIAGKDKGKSGKISMALPKELKVVVEGINIKRKHTRPKREGQKGQVIQVAMPMDVSNVKLLCGKCEKPARVGFKFLEGGKKVRVCHKCGAELI